MSHRYRCPYCQDEAACNLMCYDEIERAVEFEGPDTVACIITEPVQNAGGCIPPGSMDYFKKIRKLCDETGILMIMDEVICGFGRLGELFGSTYFGVEPDVITTAKGITSSYAPLGAVLVRKSRCRHHRRGRRAQPRHYLRWSCSRLCAPVSRTSTSCSNEDLPGKAKETGAYLQSQLGGQAAARIRTSAISAVSVSSSASNWSPIATPKRRSPLIPSYSTG